MDIVTLDFETFYAKDYTLSKMTTEAYIRDDRFEVIGVSVKVNDNPTDWFSGDMEATGRFLNSLDYSDKAILCHNTVFDGAILSWHFGIKPKFWFDTLSMARPTHQSTVGGSLKNLALAYHLGEKGTAVVDAFGKRRTYFTPAQLANYGEYCVNDTEITYKLFKKLKVGFPVKELMVIDQTIRMYTEPVVELNWRKLERHLSTERERKLTLLNKLGNGDPEAAKKKLMSSVRFAALLAKAGATPPTKISPTTGKETFAFAKTDQGMKDLLRHPSPVVRAITEVRLGVKSTIEERRTERLIDVAKRGTLPILLNYYGAHTGRFSGGDKLNLQNLPSRENNVIRTTLCAPDGHKFIACDSAQIEARLLAYIAGQADLVQAFREGRDVYSEFASLVYGRKVDRKRKEVDADGKEFKPDEKEGFVGKTCIAEGTEVLCHTGWKPIEQVTTADKLWDGKEWVCHKGLVNNGIKETLNLCGSWLTPDHQVWLGTQWLEARSVVRDKSILSQVLATGAENLPLQATYEGCGGALAPSSWGVPVAAGSTPWTNITSRILSQPVVQYAQKKLAYINGTGHMPKLCPMIPIGLGYSTGYLLLYQGAITPATGHTNTMVSGVSQCSSNGGMIEPRFSPTYKHSPDGTYQNTRWIEQTWTRDISRGIYGLYRVARTCLTSVRSRTLRRKLQVYDLACAGPRNRFVIRTDAGPVIVHNCILGLGYGMGPAKFRDTLAQAKIFIDESEAKRIVYLYRDRYPHIKRLWDICGRALTSMTTGQSGVIANILPFAPDGIALPNGMKIRYNLLRATDNGFAYISDARTHSKYVKAKVTGTGIEDLPWTNIYGGKMVENIIQALARIVVTDQMLDINAAGHRVVFQVHDENIICVADAEVVAAQQVIERAMSVPPAWAPDLPIACESGVGVNYGECK